MVFVISYFPREGSVCSWCRVWILPGPLVGLPSPQTYLLVKMLSWVEGSDPHPPSSLFILLCQTTDFSWASLSIQSSHCSYGLTISVNFTILWIRCNAFLWPADSAALSHGFTFHECLLPSSPPSFPSAFFSSVTPASLLVLTLSGLFNPSPCQHCLPVLWWQQLGGIQDSLCILATLSQDLGRSSIICLYKDILVFNALHREHPQLRMLTKLGSRCMVMRVHWHEKFFMVQKSCILTNVLQDSLRAWWFFNSTTIFTDSLPGSRSSKESK